MPKKKVAKEDGVEEMSSEDIVFEDGSDEVVDKVRKVKEQLKQCEKERQEYLDGWQRARADALNKEKLFQEEKGLISKRTSVSVLSSFFPVLDSFDMAFSNKEVWNAVDSNWRVGVEHIYTQIKKVFEDNGVTSIDTVGEKFNPEIHEPIENKEVSDITDDDTVIEVLQKGYRTADMTLRPAKVIIGKFNK